MTTDKRLRKTQKRKLTKVKGYPGIFKIWIWDGDKGRYVEPRSAVGSHSMNYRAVKRVKVLGKWTQKSQNFVSLEESRKWKEQKLNSKEVIQAKTSPHTLREVISQWREWSKPPRLCPSTWQIYGKDVSHFNVLLDMPVKDITAEDVDQWLKYVLDPEYPKTKGRVSFLREVKVLTTLFNWYREYKNSKFQSPLLKRHRRDCYFKPKPGKPDISLSVEDVERFLDQLKRTHRPVYYYLASFQALCGTRIGEACGLTWNYVDLENATIEIQQTCFWHYRTKEPLIRENTKTGEFRTVVIPEKLVLLLRKWRQLEPSESIVFHNQGKLLKYNAVQNAYKRAYRALGLPNRSTHVLRHSFASIYADQTGDIRGTQAALGHRDLRVTQHYAKVAERTQRKAIVNFDFGKIKRDLPSPDRSSQIIQLKPRR